MSFGSTCVKYICRGAGLGTLYLTGKDAHTYGKIEANAYAKTRDAKAGEYYLNNTLTLDTPNMTKGRVQDAVYNFNLDHNIRSFINSFIGYFKGLFTGLTTNAVPVALGLTALLAKKPAIFKSSAIGLGVVGLYTFIKDGLGIGKSPKNLELK